MSIEDAVSHVIARLDLPADSPQWEAACCGLAEALSSEFLDLRPIEEGLKMLDLEAYQAACNQTARALAEAAGAESSDERAALAQRLEFVAGGLSEAGLQEVLREIGSRIRGRVL